MNIKLLKVFIKESLGREIFSNPQMFANTDTAGLTQKELTKIKSIDKTKLKSKKILKELILAAGPETYIRFQNNFDDSDFPSLGVSPKVQFQTPHGIYGYPLNQDNLQSLVISGKPTNAEFATDYLFFHVYKLDKSKTANIKKNDKDTNIIQGRYTSKTKVVNDIAECIRLSVSLINHKKKEEVTDQVYINFKKDIQNIRSIKYNEGIELEDFYKKYHNFVSTVNKKEESLINIYKFEIAESLYTKTRTAISNYYSNASISKQLGFFIILKQAINSISKTISNINNTSKGQYYSLLLKSVGILGITDYATGTIHPNEPSQSVSFDFSGDTIKPIGTYRNIFKNIYDNKEEQKKLVKEFNEVLENLVSKNLVDWQVKPNKDISNFDFKNLSLNGFIATVKYKNSDKNKLFDFISNVAKENKNQSVVNYIYENFKDFTSISRIPIFNFLLENKTTKISEVNMKKHYIKFVKPKLNILDKEGVHLGNSTEFITSPSLPKSIMIDIIKNTSNKGWEYFGRFRQDPIIEALSKSKVLDKDICDMMIKKFSLEKLTFLKLNNSAPVVEILINQIKEILNNKAIIQKNSNDILKILEISELLFKNKHTLEDNFLYLCKLSSPIFKNYYGKNYKNQSNEIDFMLGITIQNAMSSMIFNKYFNSKVLNDMNITVKEEINILHNILEGSWLDEYSFDLDEFGETPKEFNLIKDGIPYLEQHSNGKELKMKLSRAYNFIR